MFDDVFDYVKDNQDILEHQWRLVEKFICEENPRIARAILIAAVEAYFKDVNPDGCPTFIESPPTLYRGAPIEGLTDLSGRPIPSTFPQDRCDGVYLTRIQVAALGSLASQFPLDPFGILVFCGGLTFFPPDPRLMEPHKPNNVHEFMDIERSRKERMSALVVAAQRLLEQFPQHERAILYALDIFSPSKTGQLIFPGSQHFFFLPSCEPDAPERSIEDIVLDNFQGIAINGKILPECRISLGLLRADPLRYVHEYGPMFAVIQFPTGKPTIKIRSEPIKVRVSRDKSALSLVVQLHMDEPTPLTFQYLGEIGIGDGVTRSVLETIFAELVEHSAFFYDEGVNMLRPRENPPACTVCADTSGQKRKRREPCKILSNRALACILLTSAHVEFKPLYMIDPCFLTTNLGSIIESRSVAGCATSAALLRCDFAGDDEKIQDTLGFPTYMDWYRSYGHSVRQCGGITGSEMSRVSSCSPAEYLHMRICGDGYSVGFSTFDWGDAQLFLALFDFRVVDDVFDPKFVSVSDDQVVELTPEWHTLRDNVNIVVDAMGEDALTAASISELNAAENFVDAFRSRKLFILYTMSMTPEQRKWFFYLCTGGRTPTAPSEKYRQAVKAVTEPKVAWCILPEEGQLHLCLARTIGMAPYTQSCTQTFFLPRANDAKEFNKKMDLFMECDGKFLLL